MDNTNMNTIKFSNNKNTIKINNTLFYKINYTKLYNFYYTINKVNYSNSTYTI